MGSFNTTCSLTGKVISQDTETIMVLLTRKSTSNALATHAWDNYAPVPIVFEGKYNSYGTLEDAKLFQSREILNHKQLEIADKYIFKQLKNNTVADYEGYDIKNPKNLSELMTGRDWGFTKVDKTVEVLKSLLNLSKELGEEASIEAINVYQKIFGKFNSINEVKVKIEELEKNKKINIIPIRIVYFEKESYLKLVNEYGAAKDDIDEDVYAQIVQNERSQGLPPERGTRCIMLGEENFAGSNYPAYTLSRDLKEEVKKVLDREAIRNLENLHIQDLTLVNDYFSMLGRSWMPSMVVSEEIESYGHSEALDFQRELLSKPQSKKLKP